MITANRLHAVLHWSAATIGGVLVSFVASRFHGGYPVLTDVAQYGAIPALRLGAARLGGAWLPRLGLGCALRQAAV